ncbi:haloacid dehalogenase superfamily, subfamily IA, variant 3 with third motif having DD or ED [Paenisporosarcina quisquiliarum]|nr:haloacid dehalogenase superfamily, subfamily IA, variant 3 with third motif having DD or ED [Paenisporosarcina quisquiliarum]
MIKGIIFDFDGLILDTESHQYELFQQLFEEHNVELPFERWLACIGTKTDFSLFSYLTEQSINKISEKQLRSDFHQLFVNGLAEMEAREGVREYLKEAKELGLSIGLASSSDRKWVRGHLSNLGLIDYFDCILTSDDVEYVKPSPELYTKAVNCLGLKPDECIAFEDSVNGMTAAKAAGLTCFVVPNFVTSHMTFNGMDGRLSSMNEKRLSEIIETVQGIRK